MKNAAITAAPQQNSTSELSQATPGSVNANGELNEQQLEAVSAGYSYDDSYSIPGRSMPPPRWRSGYR